MEQTIDHKILAKAVLLFNKKGLAKTTLRDVADTLDISDGHLRYYFKTKEKLVLSTFRMFEKEIASFENAERNPSFNWEILANALIRTFTAMHKYGYFFMDAYAIDEYRSVKKAYTKLMEGRRQLFQTVFDFFRQQGLFHSSLDATLLPMHYEQFFIISDNWMKYMRNRKNEVDRKINHYAALCLGLLLPYFSDKYHSEAKRWVKSNLYTE